MPNETDETAEYVQLRRLYREMANRNRATIVIEVLLWSFLCFTTLSGNLFTLFAMYRNRRLRTTTNMFLASLAVSDLGFAVVNALPLGVPALVLGRWPFSYEACQFQGYMAIVVAAASMQTLAWTAVNRFFRVVKTSKYNMLFLKKKTLGHIIVTWVMSFVLPGAYFAVGGKFVFHPTKFLCFFSLDSATINAVFMASAVLLPGIIISYCYFRVFLTVRRHNSQISQSGKVNAEEIRVTKTFFTIVFAYAFSWLPILVIDLVDFLNGKYLMPRWLYYIYGLLAISSSSVNPIIYVLMNPIFRTEYLRLLACLKLRKNNDEVINISVIGGRGFSWASRSPAETKTKV